jgi:hypothetical protein
MSKSRAIAIWGKPDGACRRLDPYDPSDRSRACYYGGFMKTRRGIESGPTYASFDYVPSGEVTSVRVSLDTAAAAASASGRRFYDLALPKVRSFKTNRNIRLLATMESARRAYGIPTPPEDEFGKTRAFSKVIVRQPGACTVFWGNTGHKTLWTTIDSIEIYSTEWCPPDPEPPPPPPPPEP